MPNKNNSKQSNTSKHAPQLHQAGTHTVHPTDQALLRAQALHQQGQLAKAQSAYEAILRSAPKHFNALYLLGTLFAQIKQPIQSLVCLDQAITINPLNAHVFNNRGIVLMELKRFDEAAQSFGTATSLDPDFAQAHANKGNALLALGQQETSIQSYQRAISLTPGVADAYNNLGAAQLAAQHNIQALHSFERAALIKHDFAAAYFNAARASRQLGDLNRALRLSEKAIQIDHTYLDAYNNLGNIQLELGHYEAALKSFERGLSLNANAPQLHNNRGNVLRELKEFELAIASYRRAIAIYPRYPDALNNLGNTLQELKRFEEALECYDQALLHNPRFADALSNKGAALRELKRPEAALGCYVRAIELNPSLTQAYFNAGNALKDLNSLQQARLLYQRTLCLNPGFQAARWASVLACIPSLQESVEHLESSRTAYSQALVSLERLANDPGFLSNQEAVGLHQPFYLAYQERDNKALMQQYGALCHQVMSHWQAKQSLTSAQLAKPDTFNDIAISLKIRPRKIKLGIVSDQIRYHSVWNAITKGLVEHLDISRFELHIFYLGTVVDAETQRAKSLATTFTQNLPNLSQWAQSIAARELDALLYPEVGMHALTTQLAHLRLAPVQMVSWGHPHTTGCPTLDYFLSAQLFETERSAEDYTERLVTLPSLGCTYKELGTQPLPLDLSVHGIRPHNPKLLCAGSVFKYSVDYDWVYPAIAKKLGPCQFIFLFKEGMGAELFKRRLTKAFESYGLDVHNHVVFMPWLSPGEFYGLMNAVDVFMDSLGFSGFNTAMQALECALPIAAKEARFMRGRFASAILRRLELHSCVATSDNEYVDLVVRLASEPAFNSEVRQTIAQRRQELYNDTEPVRAIEQFLITKCQVN